MLVFSSFRYGYRVTTTWADAGSTQSANNDDDDVTTASANKAANNLHFNAEEIL